MLRIEGELWLIVGQGKAFAVPVHQGLEGDGWLTCRELVRLLVRHVGIGPEEVKIVFRVPHGPSVIPPETGGLPV